MKGNKTNGLPIRVVERAIETTFCQSPKVPGPPGKNLTVKRQNFRSLQTTGRGEVNALLEDQAFPMEDGCV